MSGTDSLVVAFALACVSLVGVCAGPSENAALATARDFNLGWQWRPAAETAWRSVDLPHDFMMELPWSKDAVHSQRVFKPLGAAVYRKTFAYDPHWDGRRVVLDFGGILFFGDVWVNGIRVASTEFGWLGFETDVTDCLKRDAPNLVEVRAEVRGGPNGCRWYTGGGLCRSVTLRTFGKTRIARHGVHVTTRENRFVDLEVEVEGLTMLTNDVAVTAEISGNGFRRTLKASVPKRDHRRRVTVPFAPVEVPDAKLWFPDEPNLYDLTVRMGDDSRKLRFGFRTISFDKAHGFKLNGKKTFLLGMANHADWGALGAAAYPDAIRRQFRRMKAFGYNAVRCSHNPYPEEFYDLADEMGLLVVDEITDKWGDWWAGRKPYLEIWPDLLTEWVRRDRNHPSVILWSLGNELQHEERSAGYATDDWGVTTYRMMDVLVKRWDATRPTTVAMYPSRARGIMKNDPRFWEKAFIRAPELARETKVASFNYRCDEYPDYLAKDPGLVVFQSEASTSRGLEPFFCMDRAKMVGLCYWGAIEYWGESNAWPKKGWDFSFFSHALAPRPTAYLIESGFRRDKPICRLGVLENAESLVWNDIRSGAQRLTENWNRPNGSTNDVFVFSNAPEVELFLNGRSLGKRKVPLPQAGTDISPRPTGATWHTVRFNAVAWEKGELRALASNGATHAIETTGACVGLRLAAEPGTELLKYVWIESVDAGGRVVPTDRTWVDVSVEGAGCLLALDDDDHYSDLLFNLSKKRMREGRLLAIVRLASPAAKAAIVVRSPFGESRLSWSIPL